MTYKHTRKSDKGEKCEMYKCQSYCDNKGVIRNCNCGRCTILPNHTPPVEKLPEIPAYDLGKTSFENMSDLYGWLQRLHSYLQTQIERNTSGGSKHSKPTEMP